jgi:hypothetical protein
MNNRQVASAGQAPLVAMRQTPPIGRISKPHGGRDSEEYQNGGCWSEAKH